jgi:hypothetical protein
VAEAVKTIFVPEVLVINVSSIVKLTGCGFSLLSITVQATATAVAKLSSNSEAEWEIF